MSKEIGETVKGKKIAWLLAGLAAIAIAITLITQTITVSAVSPSPAVNIGFTKDCVDTGSEVVYCTILVENKTAIIVDEDSQTAEVHYTPRGAFVQDFLPEGNWFILSAYAYNDSDSTPKALECEADADILICDIPPLPGQHLNKLETAFVNGYAQIVIYGVLDRCGEVKNTALFVGASLVPKQASDTAAFPCPVTPTPIPQPTSTPTAAASPTVPPPATIIVVTATPTNTRFVPKPPNTGDSAPSSTTTTGGDQPYVLYGILAFAAIAFGLSSTIMARRR